MCRYLLIIAVFCASLSQAQLKELSPAMQWKLDSYGDQEFPVFAVLTSDARAQVIDQRLATILGDVERYTLIHTDVERLKRMIAAGYLTYIGIDYCEGRPLNDQMILNNNIFPLHEGASPLASALTGAGVVMGVVDAGVELDHPDFQLADGSTRVYKLWDQLVDFDEAHIPDGYGFGTEWTAAEIDANLSTHLDQIQWFGHGSTVTGTACGNGLATGEFKGVAPASDMVIVSFDFSRPDFRASVASSIQYVFEAADELNQPAVVNLSLGSYYGSHDGLDPAALYIDSMLEAATGRLAVAAIGNSNSLDPYHLRVDLDEDTAFTWFEVESNLVLGYYGVFFELWADIDDFSDIAFTMGGDITEGSYQARGSSDWMTYEQMLGQTIVRSITNAAGDTLANVEYWAQERGEQVQLQAIVLQPDSVDYSYRFMCKGTGAYDIWSTASFNTSDMIQADDLPTVDEFPEIAFYQAPDRLQHMVDSYTCSDKVISVANYTNRISYENYLNEITTITGATVGDIYSSSSAGPTRDGRLKPDLAATGSLTLSAGSFAMLNSLIQNDPQKVAPGGMHMRNGGSSMAAPVVAGVAALFLEQCPEATWQDFKEALYASTAVDDYTDAVPNPRWGMGKLNGYGAVAYASIEVSLEQLGDSLFTSGGAAYQWFLDGVLLAGMTEPYLIVSEDGDYQVEVFDDNGCSRLSAAAYYVGLEELGKPEVQIFPNPNQGVFNILNIGAAQVLSLNDSYGREISLDQRWSGGEQIDISDLAAGLYCLRLGAEGVIKTLRIIKE